ncbi:MAG: D-alanyl-D-alanine carboxypeptidase [Parcubacteria group bacterium Gr01-1014_73]|nr:MAG: D-alanyl-D-alanine carboxypeptidase [Parcubacteria group bacterium Gr01-1014_73]
MENYQNKISWWSKIYRGLSVAFPFVLLSAVAVIILANLSLISTTPASLAKLPTTAPPVLNPFALINLEAKAAIVFDALENKIIYSLNGEEQLPLASLTKIMTAVVAREILPDYTTVTIDHDSVKNEGDSGLRVGEKWRLRDLLDFTLLVSSNDGAASLAAVAGAVFAGAGQNTEGVANEIITKENQFVVRMNEKARSLGLVQTYFLNETGLDLQSQVSGGYGSALDVATLLVYAAEKYPDLFEATRQLTFPLSPMDGKKRKIKNTNEAVAKIPGLLASKTGYTDLAGGNLAVLFDAGLGHPLAIVVLGSSEQGRFSDVEKLASTTISFLND